MHLLSFCFGSPIVILTRRYEWGLFYLWSILLGGWSLANTLLECLLSFHAGCFMWAPFSVYEVATYITHLFYNISSVNGGVVILLWLSAPLDSFWSFLKLVVHKNAINPSLVPLPSLGIESPVWVAYQLQMLASEKCLSCDILWMSFSVWKSRIHNFLPQHKYRSFSVT